MSNNCVPFPRAERPGTGSQAASGKSKKGKSSAHIPASLGWTDEFFSKLTPAQCAFLTGVFAMLSEHGEEALTRSCEMVIQRFGAAGAQS